MAISTRLTPRKWFFTLATLCIAAVASLLVLMNIGSAHATFFSTPNTTDDMIIFFTRLPRLLLGFIVGVALASGGSAFQSLLKNPLADPYILGVSGGAALGSVVAVALTLPFAGVIGCAGVFALASMLIVWWIAQSRGRLDGNSLLLVGVIYNAFAFALIMLINSLVTMEQAHEILLMLIGGLTLQPLSTIAMTAVGTAIGFTVLCLFSREMNLMSLGENEARHLGVNTDRFRHVIFFATSIMIGTVVSVCGLIGFVGLFIPHITRKLFGADHRLLIPASGLIGGIFLMWSDTLARTLLIHTGFATELPVGVITALIGGPFFVWVLKGKARWK